MSIKEQVIKLKEKIQSLEIENNSHIQVDDLFDDFLKAIPDEVTIREVKEQTINKVLEKIQDAGNYNNDTIWYNNYTTLYEEIQDLI
jgi:hypothetical protein